MKECMVEITVHGLKSVFWLAQTDDDRRIEVGEREEATVFPNPDAAVAAAETYLVESRRRVGAFRQAVSGSHISSRALVTTEFPCQTRTFVLDATPLLATLT